jgi:RNA polymerase sigma-70 factor (ECF subfamily)
MQTPSEHISSPASLRQRGYRYALTLTRDADRAEDLVQEAWVSVLSARGPFGFGYLCCAIRSRYVDAYRKRAPEPLEAVSTAVPCDAASPSETALTRSQLRAATAVLSPQEREVLYLSAVEGYTAAEISDLHGRPRGTVLSLIHRARRKARALLLAAAILVGVGLWLAPPTVQPTPTPAVAIEVAGHHDGVDEKAPKIRVSAYADLAAALPKLDFTPVAPTHLASLHTALVGGGYCSLGGHIATQMRLVDGAGDRYTLYETRDRPELALPTGTWWAGDVLVTAWRQEGLYFALAFTP